MPSNEWTFEQLAGDRKKLTLSGWSAPFGRPRKGAVVEEEIHLRTSKTFYGESAIATRHDFGIANEPWMLKGRWMDADLGPAGANIRALAWKTFVNDRQRVAVRWGDILAYNGMITKLKLGRESAEHIAWQMEIDVDEDEDIKRPPFMAFSPSATQLAASMEAELKAWASVLPTPDAGTGLLGQFAALREDFLDAMENLVSLVNTPSAMMLGVLRDVESFGDALVGDLARLRAGAAQSKTAVLELRDAFEGAKADMLVSPSGDFGLSWGATMANLAVSTNEILALLADIDLQAEIAERGQASKPIRATSTDTWETLSARAYGTHDRADDIRQANGVRFGERPVAGRDYTLPV